MRKLSEEWSSHAHCHAIRIIEYLLSMSKNKLFATEVIEIIESEQKD